MPCLIETEQFVSFKKSIYHYSALINFHMLLRFLHSHKGHWFSLQVNQLDETVRLIKDLFTKLPNVNKLNISQHSLFNIKWHSQRCHYLPTPSLQLSDDYWQDIWRDWFTQWMWPNEPSQNSRTSIKDSSNLLGIINIHNWNWIKIDLKRKKEKSKELEASF